jgi:ATP-dependent DNA helicase PIF1
LPLYISRCSTEDDLIFKLYLQFLRALNKQLDFFRDRILLAVHNAVINSLNKRVLELFLRAHPDLTLRRYFAINTLYSDEQSHGMAILDEMMHCQTPDGLPPFELRLRPGIPVMLLRNLNHSRGLANGSRMVLTRVHSCLLKGRLLSGEFHRQFCLIPRVKLDTDADHFPRFSQKQFPVKICYAITIYKSQNQLLKTVSVDFRRPCFTHGQLYIALFRVTNVSRLNVLLNNASNDCTDNVVYPEALLKG